MFSDKYRICVPLFHYLCFFEYPKNLFLDFLQQFYAKLPYDFVVLAFGKMTYDKCHTHIFLSLHEPYECDVKVLIVGQMIYYIVHNCIFFVYCV